MGGRKWLPGCRGSDGPYPPPCVEGCEGWKGARRLDGPVDCLGGLGPPLRPNGCHPEARNDFPVPFRSRGGRVRVGGSKNDPRENAARAVRALRGQALTPGYLPP